MSIDLITQVQTTMKSQGHSQRDIAQQTGISQGHISKILSNSIPYGNITHQKLLRYLNDHARSSQPQAWQRLVERAQAQPEEAQEELMHIMHHALKIQENNRTGD